MNNKFNKDRLIQARLFRGYTQKELADMIGIKPQTISSLELGKNTEPTYKVLQAFASVLEFDERFFVLPTPILNNTNYAFRSKKTTINKKKEQVQAIADILSEIKINIVDKYINLPKLNLIEIKHQIANTIENINKDAIERIANDIRKHWGVGNAPISNVVKLLEYNGIFNFRIFSQDINNKIDALSWLSNGNPLILLTSNKSGVRSRFDVAHELGHILLHNNCITQEKHDILEAEANYFASCFLFPKEAVFNEAINSVSLDCYINLKKRWKMSIQAIIFRLHSLNIITDNQKLYLNMQISKNGYRTQEPLDNEIKHEETFLLQEVCRELELNNIVNIDDYLYANNMRDILNIPKIEKQKIIPKFEIKNVENQYVN